jgi:DNA-directed RNA polymerase specialized sigma24 family protein
MARFDESIKHREFASASDIRDVFHEHRAELEWLAYFITGDRAVAEACVTEACALSESHNSVFVEWLLTWARHATVRSAIEAQRERIKQLTVVYNHPGFIRQVHEPLSNDWVESVVEESDALIAKLDVVCRAALVICGIHGKSVADAALMLGICKGGVQVAYRKALDDLEVTRYAHFSHQNVIAVVSN